MRDIIFRGKRLDNEEWIEGIAFPHDSGNCTMFYQHPLNGSLVGEEVDPDTVGQYTGLTDKDGKRIFEGDIIERNGERVVIVWQKTRFIALKKNKRPLTWLYVTSTGQVIGNIYDNPELMEVENDE